MQTRFFNFDLITDSPWKVNELLQHPRYGKNGAFFFALLCFNGTTHYCQAFAMTDTLSQQTDGHRGGNDRQFEVPHSHKYTYAHEHTHNDYLCRLLLLFVVVAACLLFAFSW